MIGGIFENISKTLGGGDKYFLELDDSAGTTVEPVKAPAPKAEKAAATDAKAAPAAQVKKPAAVETKAPAKDSSAKAAAPSSAETKSAETKKVAQAPAKAAKAKKQAAKTSAKKKTDKSASKSAKSVAPAESSESKVLTATDLIVNAIAAAGPIPMDSAVASENTDNDAVAKTFSTDHLLPLDNQARRQPGSSFDGFRVMAKSVTRRKGL